MKLQNPFLLFLLVAFALYCHDKDRDVDTNYTTSVNDYKLVMERGAFHYDRFELTLDKVKFIPEPSNRDDSKYNIPSETPIDSEKTIVFFKEIEEKGFWKLRDYYKAESSCTSLLSITLEKDGKIKTVICDDFERDCNELIKYIDKKIVEFEGNDLKRIYLPG